MGNAQGRGLPAPLGWLVSQLLRIRTRLLVINVIAVMVPAVGLEWAKTYERESLRALEDDMQHQAQMVRTILETNLDPRGQPRFEIVAGALRTAAKRTRMRVRLLDRVGHVVADSHAKGPPEGPEPGVPSLLWSRPQVPERRHPGRTDPGSLLQRREIRAARHGRLGTATRIHHRIHRVYLFLAMPVMAKRRVLGMVYLTRSTVPVLQSLHRLRRNLIRILAVALASTVLLSLFLAATISRPLSRLSRAAKRIAAGHRNESLHLGRRDEIGELARSFDQMVRRLDERAEYISEFAANISHEFKTPLTSIRGAAELLADGADSDPGARKRFLSNILDDVDRLNRLVSRLLELSRIEATLEQRDPFDLARLVAEVCEQFAAAAPPAVQVVGVDRPLRYLGNRQHLRSALVALLENAARYSPSDEAVRVTLSDSAEEIRVEVKDHGPGVSPANQAKIFDRFFTTDVERGGTGLGLAVVSAVVKAHDGSITLQSESGGGSTFSLALPREPPQKS